MCKDIFGIADNVEKLADKTKELVCEAPHIPTMTFLR